MDWKKALKMVVGMPETAKGASALGEVPAGTEQTVELPAGELKIAWRHIADVTIPAAGSYVISSTPAPPDRKEPRLFLAPK
jgi:hypothetical protein